MTLNLKLILFSLSIAFLSSVLIADENNQDIIDIKKTTCEDFLSVDADEAHNILVFHHGFNSGANNETIIDINKLAGISDKVNDICTENPKMTVFEVFEVNY